MAVSGGLAHSRTLFVEEDGTPMRFYAPPGPLKRQLFPLISHGGGKMCRVQEPGALILSQDRNARGAQYISSTYVLDCVKKDERLDIDDYRLWEGQERRKSGRNQAAHVEVLGKSMKERGKDDKSGAVNNKGVKVVGGQHKGNIEIRNEKCKTGDKPTEAVESEETDNRNDGSVAQACIGEGRAPISTVMYPLGRNAFTEEEDIAILMYVRDNVSTQLTETGTLLWKEMEKQKVVNRTWQTIRCRYHKYLKGNQSYKLPVRVSPMHRVSDSEKDKSEPTTKRSRYSSFSFHAEKLGIPMKKYDLLNRKMLSPEAGSTKGGTGENEAPGPSNIGGPLQKQVVEEGANRRSKGKRKVGEMSKKVVTASSEEQEEGDLRIFEIANMEFEVRNVSVDEDTAELEVPRHSFGLKEFVMGEDTPSSQSQTQVDEVSSSPDTSEGEGLQEALLSMMSEFKLSLCEVTQALLKNNGEVSSTKHFLKTGSRPDGYPIWAREDDLDLEKDDADIQQGLIHKYGTDNVAKRIAFLAS